MLLAIFILILIFNCNTYLFLDNLFVLLTILESCFLTQRAIIYFSLLIPNGKIQVSCEFEFDITFFTFEFTFEFDLTFFSRKSLDIADENFL